LRHSGTQVLLPQLRAWSESEVDFIRCTSSRRIDLLLKSKRLEGHWVCQFRTTRLQVDATMWPHHTIDRRRGLQAFYAQALRLLPGLVAMRLSDKKGSAQLRPPAQSLFGHLFPTRLPINLLVIFLHDSTALRLSYRVCFQRPRQKYQTRRHGAPQSHSQGHSRGGNNARL